MIKKILELDKKLKSNLNIFDKITLYFKVKLLSHNIKKSFFKENTITQKDLIFFVQVLNYASEYLKNFNIDEFYSWYRLIDGILGIKIFINCDPVSIVVYCGEGITYRYELALKGSFNTTLNSSREIDGGISKNSDYMYDNYVYEFVKTYITATVDVIEDIWLDTLWRSDKSGGTK